MISFSIDKQRDKMNAEWMSRPVDSFKNKTKDQPLVLVLTSMEQALTFAYRLKRKLLNGPILGGAYSDIGLLPEINNSNDYAKPFIEIDRYGYNYVCRERGEEIFRKIPYDTDELLFEIFANLTFEMATKWEAKNRKENEDFRLQLFAKQVDLMTRISKDFGDRINEKLQRILKFGLLTN